MPMITFENNGQTADADVGAKLMDITNEKDWGIAYGCESGVCGTCIIKIVEGKENLAPPTENEKETLDAMGLNDGDHRLACQCVIKGDVTFAAG